MPRLYKTGRVNEIAEIVERLVFYQPTKEIYYSSSFFIMNELFKVGLFREALTLPEDNGYIPYGTITCRTTKHALSVRYGNKDGSKDLLCGWIARA
jgi:hypothetical protein